jgi:transposase
MANARTCVHAYFQIWSDTIANITDRDGTLEMMSDTKENLADAKNVQVDGSYSGEKFSSEITDIIGATVEAAKRSELHKFVVIPKRWVVERSFAWIEKCRRLWKNCERKINTSLQMVACFYIT